MLLFLVVVIHKEENKVDYVYNKFLLERFLNKYQFKNKKIIYNINNFYKNKENIYRCLLWCLDTSKYSLLFYIFYLITI